MTDPVEPSYHMFRRRPVKILPDPEGEPEVWWLDPRTGGWMHDEDLLRELSAVVSVEPPTELTPAQFVDLVETVRAATLRGDGAVYALYQTMAAIYSTAQAENRPLTAEEMATLVGLRRRTYRMFEEDLAARGDPAAQPELAGS